MKRPVRVLYVVYWGTAEPLGQSLVMPAVARLADLGAEITLVTFEKPDDLQSPERMAVIRSTLAESGIRWIPLRYHKRPKVPATAFDLLQGCVRGLLSRLHFRPDVIHARTFIGGLIGQSLASMLGVKWVYHNEGFYPDEQVDGGVWREGSRPHRIAKALERRMYDRADGIIALSDRAEAIIRAMPAVERKETRIVVVPSCVNLEHFRLDPSRKPSPSELVRLVYVGSIGGRYRFDQAARFAAVAGDELGRAHLHVLTRTGRGLVDSILETSGLPQGTWSVDSVAHSAVPSELAGQHAGLHFLTRGIATHGGSPTKIGEYWASGLPVVTTPDAGDSDAIIEREHVGVIVREHTDKEYRRAAQELRRLLDDDELPHRCRRAAESHYALGPACERQMALYRDLFPVVRHSRNVEPLAQASDRG